jgi:hypothetical protein
VHGREAAPVRILVLWNPARRVEPEDAAAWAHERVRPIGACRGVAGIALHPVTSAAAKHPQPFGWCLELQLAPGHAPRDVVRAEPFAEFVGDMQLLGMRPSVLAIEDELR